MSDQWIVADLATDAGCAQLLALDAPDVVYTDPPWGEGNAKYWRTMAGMEVEVASWARLVERLARIICRARREVFVETSVHFGCADLWRDTMADHGWPLADTWSCLYGNPKRPNLLLRFSSLPWAGADLTDKGGMTLVRAALAGAHVGRGDIVLDPCCGLGMTPAAAKQAGATVHCCDLNAARLARARARANKVRVCA